MSPLVLHPARSGPAPATPEARPAPRVDRRYAIPERLYALDVARGIAAVAVVFYHWGHFSSAGVLVEGLPGAALPFYRQLAMLYRHGNVAVDFFFALSGFIFAWLYGSRIAEGGVSAGDFAAYRVSRLYPIHLATLLVVAALQAAYLSSHGAYFVYGSNGPRQFVSNALLVSAWGPDMGLSLNGPSWSISVEVLLYILFFLTCRLRINAWWQLLGYAALGRLLMAAGLVPVGRGLMGFFLGGLAFLGYKRVLATTYPGPWLRSAVVIPVVAWAVVIAELRSGSIGASIPLALLRLGFLGLVLPASVLGLVAAETLWGPFARRLAPLGDLSYSTYLIHFPLQLAFVLAADGLGWGREVFRRPSTVLLFLGVLLSISYASYHGFERPAQRWLRRLHQGCRSPHRGGPPPAPSRGSP